MGPNDLLSLYTVDVQSLLIFPLFHIHHSTFLSTVWKPKRKNVTYTTLTSESDEKERKTSLRVQMRERERCKLQSPLGGYKRQYYSLFPSWPIVLFLFWCDIIRCGCGPSFPPIMWAQCGVLQNKNKIKNKKNQRFLINISLYWSYQIDIFYITYLIWLIC